MSIIYFKIDSNNIVIEEEDFETNEVDTESEDFPAAKFLTDGNKPLAEEDYETVPANTWIDTDKVLLQRRSSPVLDNLLGCVYNHGDKTFSTG